MNTAFSNRTQTLTSYRTQCSMLCGIMPSLFKCRCCAAAAFTHQARSCGELAAANMSAVCQSDSMNKVIHISDAHLLDVCICI